MSPTPLVIIGCGGFGREVFSIIDAINAEASRWRVEGFVDDAPTAGAEDAVAALGSRIIGDLGALASQACEIDAVIAVGSPPTREKICRRLRAARVRYPILVHPDAGLGVSVDLAEGVVIAPGARLSTAISIGQHVQIDQNATVGHDAQIGAFARLNPQACISGAVTVGERALIGANATVLQGLEVGADAVVGASACVVDHVPVGITVKGVPAR